MRILLKPLMVLGAVALLQGCAGVVLYDGTRQSSRALIEKVMAEARPALPGDASAKCVMSGMTMAETVKLGVTDTTVVTSAARTTVLEYAQRPKAAACLNALPPAAQA